MSKIKLQNSNLSSVNLFDLTQVAYKSALAVEEFDKHLVSLPKNYEVLVKSTDLGVGSSNNLRAVAYVDPETKQVVIGVAGTNVKALSDLHDDVLLARDKAPTKVEPMKAFIAEVISQLGDSSAYTFSVTGHSLGATVAQLTALHLIAEGQTVNNCVTFDSPGAKKAFAFAVQEGQMQPVSEEKIAETNFVSIQSRPNFVNTLAGNEGNYGSSYMIVLPEEKKADEVKPETKTEDIGFLAYLQNLVSKVGSVATESFTENSEYLVKLISDSNFRSGEIKKITDIYEAVVSEIEERDLVNLAKDSQELFDSCHQILSGMTKITQVALLCSSLAALPASAAAVGTHIAMTAGAHIVGEVLHVAVESAAHVAITSTPGIAVSYATGDVDGAMSKANGVMGNVVTRVTEKVAEKVMQTGADIIGTPFTVAAAVSQVATAVPKAISSGAKVYSQVSKLLQEMKKNIELIKVTEEHLLESGWREALENDHVYKVKGGYSHLKDKSVELEFSAKEIKEMQEYLAKHSTEDKAPKTIYSKIVTMVKKVFGFTENPEIVGKDENGKSIELSTIEILKKFLAEGKQEAADALNKFAEAASTAMDVLAVEPTDRMDVEEEVTAPVSTPVAAQAESLVLATDPTALVGEMADAMEVDC